MTNSRSLLVWTTLLSLLFSVASAVALPDNDDHKWARHVTKTITVTATSIQTCSTHISLGTTSSHSSVLTSCPSVAAQITKTVTASSTITVTSRSTILSTANNPKAITVTKTDTVTSVIPGSKGASATSATSTVTVTRTVASDSFPASTSTVTVTVPQSGTARTVTATISVSASTVTITQTLPQSDLTKTITAAASDSTSTVTITSDITTTITSDIATTVTATTTTTVNPSASCTNPVVNPGFEDGTTGWTFSQQNPGISFTVEPSSSIPGGAHSGSYAGAFVSNDGPFLPGIPSDIYQYFSNIDPACGTSGKYQISGFVKTAANQCYINIFNDPNSGQAIASIQIYPGGTDPLWEEFVAPVDAPMTSLTFLVFEAACNTQDPVWFDDFTVMPM